MAYAWQTVEQAAVTLGISTRTIARRITKGEIESRLSNGRREVYICLPHSGPVAEPVETVEGELTGNDAPSYRAPNPAEAEEEYEQTVRHTVAASSMPGADVETGTALILAEDRARRAELAISVIQQSTAIVRDEVRTARIGARWAWSTVAVLSAGVVVAVAWTSSNVTRSQSIADAMREKAASVSNQAEQLTKEQRLLRAELEGARMATARVEGQLEEVRYEAELAHAQIAKALTERQTPTTPSTSTTRPTAAKVANSGGGGE
jgi:hypothetical protein